MHTSAAGKVTSAASASRQSMANSAMKLTTFFQPGTVHSAPFGFQVLAAGHTAKNTLSAGYAEKVFGFLFIR